MDESLEACLRALADAWGESALSTSDPDQMLAFRVVQAYMNATGYVPVGMRERKR